MRRHAEIKPSRATSILAVVVGLGMITIGSMVFFGLSQAGGVLARVGGPVSQIGGAGLNLGLLFIGVWILTAVGITVYHLVNVFSKNGTAAEVIDYYLPDAGASVASQLRELEQLRADGLITASEYEEKRGAILNKFG